MLRRDVRIAPSDTMRDGSTTSRAPPGDYRVGTGDRCLTLSFYSSSSQIENEWLAFEKRAVCTLYQSYRWVSAWCHSAAAQFDEKPLFVVARDGQGEIAFILPMAKVRRFGVGFLSWLSQFQSAYNMGLYRQDVLPQLDAVLLREILAGIRKTCPELSGAMLTDQPLEWEGHENPIARLDCVHVVRERCYALPLKPCFDDVCATNLSHERRTELRRKWRRLSEYGDVAVGIARTYEDRTR